MAKVVNYDGYDCTFTCNGYELDINKDEWDVLVREGRISSGISWPVGTSFDEIASVKSILDDTFGGIGLTRDL